MVFNKSKEIFNSSKGCGPHQFRYIQVDGFQNVLNFFSTMGKELYSLLFIIQATFTKGIMWR